MRNRATGGAEYQPGWFGAQRRGSVGRARDFAVVARPRGLRWNGHGW
jgi:hypothetical protein